MHLQAQVTGDREGILAICRWHCPNSWTRTRGTSWRAQRDWRSNRSREALAKTRGVDLWYLFPLGVAVNRLLKKDGSIDETIKARLNDLFGSDDWYDVFYRTATTNGLFGEQKVTYKAADFGMISDYFTRRLDSIFTRVAPNPLPLLNSRNVPLYLLCFASANKTGAPTAVKIAQHILGSA